jgi:hypothetical protein
MELHGHGETINGTLGDNTGTNKSSPVSVVGGFTDWIQVSASNRHSLGVRAMVLLGVGERASTVVSVTALRSLRVLLSQS